MPRSRRRTSAALLALAALFAVPVSAQEADRPQLALMGSIPIYWGEADGFGELLDSADHAHWARAVIERDYALAPLDFLSAEALAPYRMLLLAQPRALAPEENVALDAWVRGGGRLLLFADPMMTGDSRFALGDRRRPMDVSLLSPILAHWGVELQYDGEQEEGLHWIKFAARELPVNLPGRFHHLSAGECTGVADALMTRCQIGEGRALLFADAALLDFAGPHRSAEHALQFLLDEVFGENGDETGGFRRRIPSYDETPAILPPPVPPSWEADPPDPPPSEE